MDQAALVQCEKILSYSPLAVLGSPEFAIISKRPHL